jgi:hypothetical protein
MISKSDDGIRVSLLYSALVRPMIVWVWVWVRFWARARASA